jgi:integrase
MVNNKNFMDTLETNLKSKNLSPSSINLYLRNLKKLNNDEDYNDFKFLKDTEQITKKLENLKDNTKRQYLIAIVSVLNSYGDKYEKLRNSYYKLMKDMTLKLKETPTTEMSITQNENWITWDDVLEVYKKMKEELDKIINSKKKVITELQFNKLLRFVILSLYVLIPPRRNLDWLDMVITFNSDTSDKTKNYLDVNKKEFVLNVFKTSKKDGSMTIPIPDNLMDILMVYITYREDVKEMKKKKAYHNIPLIVNYDGSKISTVNFITRLLNKVFGKKISSSMLRHIYLSSKYGEVMKEQQEDSKMMSHNMTTQKDYIKLKQPNKIINDNEDITVNWN